MSLDRNFQWMPAPGGYGWVPATVDAASADQAGQLMLGEICADRAPAAGPGYKPFVDFPGLFLVLADVTPTPEGILAFASRFGRLGRDRPGARSALGLTRDGRPARLTEECLELWELQIGALKRVARLWHQYQIGATEALAARVHWGTDAAGREEVSFVSGPHDDDLEPIACRSYHPERLATLSPADPGLSVLCHVQDAVNARIGSLAAPQLLWDPDAAALTLQLVPETLLAAVWLQLAAAVAEDKAFRQCGTCGLWIELRVERGRTTKQFCSNACRTRAHRARQERALQLHSEGKSPRVIAKDLATELSTVKKWINQMQG